MPSVGVKTKSPLQVTVVKLLMSGRDPVKINPVRAAVPPALVKLTAPLAPLPTTAVMVVEESTWKVATDNPPNVIAEVVFKLVPVIVMVAPAPALEGVKEVIVGTTMVGSKETLPIKLAPVQLPAIGLISKCSKNVSLVACTKCTCNRRRRIGWQIPAIEGVKWNNALQAVSRRNSKWCSAVGSLRNICNFWCWLKAYKNRECCSHAITNLGDNYISYCLWQIGTIQQITCNNYRIIGG